MTTAQPVDLTFLQNAGIAAPLRQDALDELRKHGIQNTDDLKVVRQSKIAWPSVNLIGVVRSRLESVVPEVTTEDSGAVLARLSQRQDRETQQPWRASLRFHEAATEVEKRSR